MNYKIENGIAGPIIIFRDGLKRENYFNIPSNIFNIIKDLQKENQQLKEQIKQYTDPDDLTLMFMYCEEKAKDKIKELKRQLETSEKARKESMRILGEYRHYTLPTEEQNRENEDIIDKAYNNLILKQDIDKGE